VERFELEHCSIFVVAHQTIFGYEQVTQTKHLQVLALR
jgi:hypothetical protein